MFNRDKNPTYDKDEAVIKQGIKEDINELEKSIEKETEEMKTKLIQDGRDPESANRIIQEVKKRAIADLTSEYKRRLNAELRQIIAEKNAPTSSYSK